MVFVRANIINFKTLATKTSPANITTMSACIKIQFVDNILTNILPIFWVHDIKKIGTKYKNTWCQISLLNQLNDSL